MIGSTGRLRVPVGGAARRRPRQFMLVASVFLSAVVAACDGADDGTRLQGSGTLEAETARVVTDTPGRVTRVAVDVGDTVAAGAVLATLDATLLASQLAEAEAALAAAQAEQDRLGALPRAEELAVAEAALALAVAQRDAAAAALDLARAGESGPGLAGGGANLALAGGASPSGSGPSVDAAQTALRQAEAAVTSARTTLDAVRQGAPATDIAAAAAGVRQAEAALAAVRARRARLTLRAPIAGRVLSRAVERGGLALAGTTLVRVADLDHLTVTVYVPEDALHRVQVGDAVEVSVDAYPDDTFDGRVTTIASVAEFTPRNAQTEAERAELVFAVKAEVPNSDGRLKPGMPADVAIDTGGAD